MLLQNLPLHRQALPPMHPAPRSSSFMVHQAAKFLLPRHQHTLAALTSHTYQCSAAHAAGKEAALLFPTGFAANVAVVAALAGALGPHLFSDALNHASIIDGARTAQRAGACLHVFRHRDMGHLEELLAVAPPGRNPFARPSVTAVPPPNCQPLLFRWQCPRKHRKRIAVRKLAVGSYGLCRLKWQGCTACSESSLHDFLLTSTCQNGASAAGKAARQVIQDMLKSFKGLCWTRPGAS